MDEYTGTVIEQIKEVLIEMQNKVLAGVYIGHPSALCPCCGGTQGKKIEAVSVYWDKLMTLVQSSTPTVRNGK